MKLKYKPVKAFSVIFDEESPAYPQDLVTWIFDTKKQAKGFMGKNRGKIIPVIIKQIK